MRGLPPISAHPRLKRECDDSVGLADVFVPDFRMGLDVGGEKRGALFGIKINHLHAERTKPVNAALKGAAFADHEGAEAKLADQPAAIPARRECGDHNEIAIAALASRATKCVGFGMRRRVALLDATVVSCAYEAASGIKDCGADRESAFGETLASLGEGDGKHRGVVRFRWHVSSNLPSEMMPVTSGKLKRDGNGGDR